MANERINDLNMTAQDIVIALGGGNPGAITVCCELLANARVIDPDAAFEGFAPLLGLDSDNIWEERIWMLYKDVCGQDLVKMVAVLRARQLGLCGITAEVLHHAIDNCGEGIDVDKALEAVKEKLPRFASVVCG